MYCIGSRHNRLGVCLPQDLRRCHSPPLIATTPRPFLPTTVLSTRCGQWRSHSSRGIVLSSACACASCTKRQRSRVEEYLILYLSRIIIKRYIIMRTYALKQVMAIPVQVYTIFYSIIYSTMRCLQTVWYYTLLQVIYQGKNLHNFIYTFYFVETIYT